MKIEQHETAASLGSAAWTFGKSAILRAIDARGAATIVVATGASQFDLLERLTSDGDIDWSKVTAFHLDEYVGLPVSHPASFRRYLRERFASRLPALKAFHEIDGSAPDPQAEAARLSDLIAGTTTDVCFAGIGENCHLAFNDPPADFETDRPFIVVTLDAACRRQQVGEGWFDTMDDVPAQAISMSVPQIMAAGRLVLSVPDARKADAAAHALEGPVTPDRPASIVQRHGDVGIFLDPASGARLTHAPQTA